MKTTILAVQYVAAPRSFPLASSAIAPRRRAFLNSSCAVNALLVMPAALSVGVLLAGPAQAATTLAGTGSGISLATYGTIDNPFTITGGTTISGAEDGIFGSDAGAWTLSNAGMVKTTGSSNVAGILFSGGGALTNTGTILDTMPIPTNFGVSIGGGAASIVNSGQISGFVGVGASDGGSIDNTGLIAGNGTGVVLTGSFGNVTNLGSITGGGIGVSLGSGGAYLLNGATVVDGSVTTAGYISGGIDGVLLSGANGTVVNAGTIFGNNIYSIQAYGVLLTDGGTVRNDVTGTIGGENVAVGIDGAAGTVLNSGIIDSWGGDTYSAIGVGLQSGGYVSNASTGTIFGAEIGIGIGTISAALAGTVVNDGSVGGSLAIVMFGPGSISNDGYVGGTFVGVFAGYTLGSEIVTNAESGVITGAVAGVALASTDDTLFNAGTITGGYVSFAIASAVALTGGTVTNTGLIRSDYVGIQDLGTTDASAVTVLNSGTIDGGMAGILLHGGGDIGNAAGGTISSAGDGIFDRYGNALSISNAAGGTISGGTYGINVYDIGQIAVSNAGAISGGGHGVAMDSGSLTNAAGGLITGSIGVGLATGMLVNAGTIIGTIGSGLVGEFVGVTNQSGGTISGAYNGIYLRSRQPSTISNEGLIAGANGDGISAGYVNTPPLRQRFGPLSLANAGMISGTDVGVDLFAGGTIDNQAGGTISGGTYGVQAYSGVNMYAAVIRNAGLITDAPAPAHAAVEMGDGVTLNNLNTGTISGEAGILVGGAGDTIVNAGTIIATDRRDAIVLLPAAEDTQITLTTGSTLTGDIFGGGTDSQIFLTGDDSMDNAISGFGDGALTVQPGASWTASGFWTIANVTNDGRFQAGFPGSPLNLTGNFVQASNGTLQVVVTPEATSQFIIDGAAQLAGKLSYEFAPGSYSPHTYDFLTATGGITGAFSKVSSNAPKGVTASTYGVTDTAALVLTGNSVPAGGGGGKTPAPPPGSRPLVIVKPLDDSIYADANQTAAEAAQEISGDLLDHATTPGPAGGGGNCAAAAAAQAVTTPGTGSGGQIANALAAAFCQAGGWLEVSGGAGDVSANGGAAAYETDTGGMLAGIDKQVNEGGTRLGFVVGYDETWLHDGAGGTASIDTTRAGLYGTQPLGFFTLAGDFMAGFARNTGTRATGIGTAHAAYDSTVYAGALQLGTSGTLDGAIIAPAIGIRAASVAADGFSESGGGEVPEFAVTGHDSSYASLQPYVKLGIAKVYQTASGITIVPNVSVAYVNDIGNTGIGVGVSSRDGTRFSSGFDDLDDDMADISAGISASRGNWSVYARYRGYITRNWNEEIGEAGVAVRF